MNTVKSFFKGEDSDLIKTKLNTICQWEGIRERRESGGRKGKRVGEGRERGWGRKSVKRKREGKEEKERGEGRERERGEKKEEGGGEREDEVDQN